MNDENPYQTPLVASEPGVLRVSGDADSPKFNIAIGDAAPVVSTHDTVAPRYIAAVIDNVVAMILAVIAAESIGEDLMVLQLAAAVAAYLAYYFVFEGLMARTPGKLVTGLVVIQLDGRRCNWRQAFIRSLFRLFEVNPALFGALPAALCIVISKHRQRFGDRIAGTVVVPSDRWAKFRAGSK